MTDNDSGPPLPPLEPGPGPSPDPTPAGDVNAGPPPIGAAPAEATTVVTKPDIGKRVLAYVIDWVIAMVLFAIVATINGALGALVGAAYILLRDGFDFEFMKGRSVGKRMMKLTVVRDDGGEMDLMTSAKRNWTLALSMLPLGLLWLILAPVAVLIGLFEVYNVLTRTDGRRWGDRLAGTHVIETDE